MSDQPVQILIADDEAPIRMTMQALLRRRGYDVIAADNGEAALAQIFQRPFDLLLLDLKMPGLSGIEVAKRARERQPDVAIIILTGHGSLDSALDGMHVGMFDYLLKTTSRTRCWRASKRRWRTTPTHGGNSTCWQPYRAWWASWAGARRQQHHRQQHPHNGSMWMTYKSRCGTKRCGVASRW